MANIINLSLNFQPGVSYKLKIPTTLNNDGGFTCKDGSVTLSSGDIVELKKGFCVLDFLQSMPARRAGI